MKLTQYLPARLLFVLMTIASIRAAAAEVDYSGNWVTTLRRRQADSGCRHPAGRFPAADTRSHRFGRAFSATDGIRGFEPVTRSRCVSSLVSQVGRGCLQLAMSRVRRHARRLR